MQGGANGSDDERPSGYRPRPLTVGTAPITASLSAPQLSANDGDEEVCPTYCDTIGCFDNSCGFASLECNAQKLMQRFCRKLTSVILSGQVRLVDGICALGGVRAQPSREDLRLFVENIASLNGTRVAELLHAKMVGTWPLSKTCLYQADCRLHDSACACLL